MNEKFLVSHTKYTNGHSRDTYWLVSKCDTCEVNVKHIFTTHTENIKQWSTNVLESTNTRIAYKHNNFENTPTLYTACLICLENMVINKMGKNTSTWFWSMWWFHTLIILTLFYCNIVQVTVNCLQFTILVFATIRKWQIEEI